jgi:hypothetical protein
VRFSVDERVEVTPSAALAAYGTPAFYEGRPPRDNISVVEVVSHEVKGSTILMEVRFKFTGGVTSAVRAVIDPNKMSWITRTTLHPDEHRSRFEVLADHYPDRLTANGTFTFTDGEFGPESAVVKVEGDLKVHVPIVGRGVERVIVSGLRSYIAAEVAGLPDFIAGG